MMPVVGYARVSSIGQDLGVQLEKLEKAGCHKVFKEKRSGVDAGRPELKRCLEYLREGDTLLVTKIDRLARSTSDLYRNLLLALRKYGDEALPVKVEMRELIALVLSANVRHELTRKRPIA